MGKIRGIDVILYEKTKVDEDAFGAPIYTETEVTVKNVLVIPSEQATEIIDDLRLEGKKAVYVLAIPKGDNHNWKDVKVKFFNETFKTFGMPKQGIEEMIPLDWNKKVMVERYE